MRERKKYVERVLSNSRIASLKQIVNSRNSVLAPNFWKSGKSRTPYKKRLFSVGKRKQMLPKKILRLRDTYKKYILQKNWVKTAIPALSSGPSNLPESIWGRHHQLDDQHRNPNMNDKDHLVGRLTMRQGNSYPTL